jgi:hypothetical protein
MNNEQKMYTEEQLRLALLEQCNTGILETLKEIKQDLKSQNQDLKSQFHWIMGSVSALYIALFGILVTALAKSLHWF